MSIKWCDYGDFTGAHVTSDAPIFIQSGISGGWIANDPILDHYADYVPPVDRLGNLYVIIPTPSIPHGDILRITGNICTT